MNRVTLIGEGQTRVFANQRGMLSLRLHCLLKITSVVKVPQVISMSPIPDLAVGDFPFQLEANSTSGLPVTFYSSNPALATVVGEYVYIRGAGEVTITATQEGDRRYEPAASVDRNFTISWGKFIFRLHPRLKLWFDATDVNGDGDPMIRTISFLEAR